MFDHAKCELERISDDFLICKSLAAMSEPKGFYVYERLNYFTDKPHIKTLYCFLIHRIPTLQCPENIPFYNFNI